MKLNKIKFNYNFQACLLNLLGAHWSSKNFYDKRSPIMTILEKLQFENKVLLEETNRMMKWWLLRARDIYGHNLLHRGRIYKTFFYTMTYEWANKARVFVHGTLTEGEGSVRLKAFYIENAFPLTK